MDAVPPSCSTGAGWSPGAVRRPDRRRVRSAHLPQRQDPARAHLGVHRPHLHRRTWGGPLLQLADRKVRLRLSAAGTRRHGRKTITLRQIVRLNDGHQTRILTSRLDLSTAEIAAWMFNRWRQENYFRYTRAHFALDGLDTYTVVDDDPQRSVPNPAKRAAHRQVRRLEQVVADGEATFGPTATPHS